MANIDIKTIIQYLTIMELPLDKPISQEIVKSQYRKLAKVFHPDAHQEIYADGEKFKLLKSAYDFLYANIDLVNRLISTNFQNAGSRNYEADFEEALRKAAMAKAFREAAEQAEREEQQRREAAERRARAERERKEDAEREAASSRQRTSQLERDIKAEEEKREALRKEAEKRKREEEAAEAAKLAKKNEEIKYLREQYIAFLNDAKEKYNPCDYDKKGNASIEDVCRYYTEKQKLIFNRNDYDSFSSKFLKELNRIKTVKQKKRIKLASIIAGCAAVVVALSVGAGLIIKNKVDKKQMTEKYENAVLLMNSGSYEEAMDYFESLGNYGDSQDKYKVCKGLVELQNAINNKTETSVINGIKSIVSGGESVYVTYSSSTGHSIKRALRATTSGDTYSETISTLDFKLYSPKENTGYTFKNWFATYVDYSNQTSLSLDSKWDLNQYSITYYLNGGTNSVNNPSSYSIESADIILQSASKEHHQFVGWYDSETGGNKVQEIPHGSSGNIKLYARYLINSYDVNFYDWDYTKLYSTKVEHGSAATYPYDNPTKPADQQYTYSFKGWDKSLLNITENTDFVAQYENTVNQYTVTFKNWDGEVLDTCTVDYGETAFYSGNTPTKPNSDDDRHYYVHSGWNKTLENVQNSYEVQATFEEHDRYLARFYNGEDLLYSVMVNENTMPSYEGETPIKESTQQYNYTFADWEPTLAAINEDTDYTATFNSNLNKYTVTFKNWDGEVLGTDTVDYGTEASYTGDTPTKPKDQQYTYTFSGWDISLAEITENVDAVAQFNGTLNKYTVTFKNYNGTILGTDTVDYGSTATYTGETPTKPKTQQYTYAFSGWNISLENVTSDRDAIAQFSNTTNKYTVTFKNYDGSILETDTVDYGTAASYSGSTPTKPDTDGDCAYRFTGWSNTFANVQNDFEVTAQYELYLKHATFTLNTNNDGYVLTNYSGNSEYVHIPDTYYGLPIVEIGADAFYNNDTLRVIDICDSITTFNGGSFAYCYSLEKMNISEQSNLTLIKQGALRICNPFFTPHDYSFTDVFEHDRNFRIYQINTIFPNSVSFETDSIIFDVDFTGINNGAIPEDTNYGLMGTIVSGLKFAVLYYGTKENKNLSFTQESLDVHYRAYENTISGFQWIEHNVHCLYYRDDTGSGQVFFAHVQNNTTTYNGKTIILCDDLPHTNFTHKHATCCD